MAPRILSVFGAAVLLVQSITCQCLGNPYGPYPGPGYVAEVGYPGPGLIGNNFAPEWNYGPGCYNPGFASEIVYPGPGIYNPGFCNDVALAGPTYLNGFAPECGPYGEIGFGGPFNPDFGYGPYQEVSLAGPGYFNGFAPEIGFGPSYPGLYPNVGCGNLAPGMAVAPAIGPLAPLNLDIPVPMPYPAFPQIGPFIDPVPFNMPPTGMSIYSDDLIIEGPVIVSGRMPFLGAVTMEGAFTSAGAGAVSYGCGDGVVGVIEGPAVATVAPSFGFAPTLPLGLPYGGFGCANRVY